MRLISVSFFLFGRTRSRNSEPYHFRRLPSALSLLAIPFQKNATHPPNPTSSSTTTFFSTSVHPHTHKVTLEIDKNRQDPVQPVCVCMTTTAISLFCLPVCVYLLMHIISSSSSCFSSSSSFLVCLIQLLLSLVVVVVVVFLFFVCWLVMLDFYISL